MDGSRDPARDTSAGVRGDTNSRLSDNAGNVVQARDVDTVHFHSARQQPESGPTPRQLPRDVGGFVGREADLKRLDRLLAGDAPPTGTAICAITGTAGVGKTALAVHWAHRVRDRFPDGQLYLNLFGYDPREPLGAAQALERFLRDLGYSGALPADLDGKAALYRSLLAERRMLVLLDNVGDVDQTRPLLPGAGPSAVVVTSRNALSGLVARDGAHRLVVGTLSEPEAVELLQSITDGYRDGDDARDLADLASLCARLPLALRLAGERATTHPYMTLADLIDDLRRAWADSDADRAAGATEPEAVSTVLAWSYRTLPAEDARMFRLLGLHPGADIGVSAAAVLADTAPGPARRQLDFLVESHLLEESTPGRYRFHSLLRAYATDLLRREEPAPRRRVALERTLDWYLRGARTAGELIAARRPHHESQRQRAPGTGPPEPEFGGAADAAGWLDAEWQNLLAAVRVAAESGLDEIAARLPPALRPAMARRSRYAEAVAIGSTGLAAARRLGDQGLEAASLDGLAAVCFQHGRVAESRDYHIAALALRRELGDRAGEAASLCELGRISRRRRRFKQALGLYQQSIEILVAIDADRRQVATAVGLAGEAYGDLDHLGEAADLAHHALDLCRSLDERPREAEALCRLARIQRLCGATKAAADTAQLALGILRDCPEPAVEADALFELAAVRLAAGDPYAAHTCYERALDACRRIGDSSGEAAAQDGMGRALHAIGHRGRAAVLHRRAAALNRELGDTWSLATALDHLAAVHYESGDLRAAQEHWLEAAELFARFDDQVALERHIRIRAALNDPFVKFRARTPDG